MRSQFPRADRPAVSRRHGCSERIAFPGRVALRKAAAARPGGRSNRVVRWTFKVRDRCRPTATRSAQCLRAELDPTPRLIVLETHALDPSW